jgi:uncharacterized protein YfaS (alpha-2-macroglobulin family)
MVELSNNEKMAQSCPIRIEPSIKGRCRWRGTQTLAFEPEQPLPPSSEYKVTIPAGTKSNVSGQVLAQDYQWRFETTRVSLQGSIPRTGEKWIRTDAKILLQFNLPMSPSRARDFIQLLEADLPVTSTVTGVIQDSPRRYRYSSGDGDEGFDEDVQSEVVPTTIRSITATELEQAGLSRHSYYDYEYDEEGERVKKVSGEAEKKVLMLMPSRPLKPDHVYAVRLKEGLPAEQGKLGMVRGHSIKFETWYTFRVVGLPEKDCLPPRYNRFVLWFTNPVKIQDLLDNIQVTPTQEKLELGEYLANQTGQSDYAGRKVGVQLPPWPWKPETVYTFTITGKLRDIFGNELGSATVFTLETDIFCPRVGMPVGFGVLEAGQKARHPVMVLNAPEVVVRKARVSTDDFIPYYLKEFSNGFRGPSGMKAKVWKPEAKRNERTHTFINLSDLFGGDNGGFAFVGMDWMDGEFRALDNVTRLGMTFKSSPDSTLVWATSLADGMPMGGVRIELRDDKNRVLWKGKTGKAGFAEAPGWSDLGVKRLERWDRPRIWAFAMDPEGDAVMSTDWRGELEPWRMNVNYDWSPRSDRYSAKLFTERGVYRAGETVNLKGYVRRLVKGDWEPSDMKYMHMEGRDSRGALFIEATLTLTGDSSFDFSFPVKEGAPTGNYHVRVTDMPNPALTLINKAKSVVNTVSQGRFSARQQEQEMKVEVTEYFRVEQFKPASFEVKVTPGAESFLAGDYFRAVVDGWYLFGAPMPGAAVDWSLRLEPGYYSPPGWEGFQFHSFRETRYERRGRLQVSSTAVLDSRGKLAVSSELDPGNLTGPMTAAFEASVTSPDRQKIFGRVTAVVHGADLYIGIKPARNFLEKGEEWKAELVLVHPDGKLAPGIAATGRVIRRQWLSTRRAGFAGRLEWISEQKDQEVAKFNFTSGDKPWVLIHKPAEPGYYIVEVDAVDGKKRPATASSSFYATGKGEASWYRRDTDIVELVPDKESYKPGDIAKILVKSPFGRARVMVTVEREVMLDHWTTELDGGAPIIEVPIRESFLPNVYVGVAMITGRAGTPKYADDGEDLAKPQGRFGYINLPVDPGGRRITVKVTTAKKYRPGDRVEVALSAKDDAGNGIPAEITLFAVDEGVLALTGYQTPDMFGEYYGPRPLQFSTADTRLFVIGQRNFGEKGKNLGGGGGNEGPSLAGIDLRSRFAATAFWNPRVMTGPDGRGQATFTLPDNLTAFRVMAVASAGKKFGRGDTRLAVSKPLMLRPSLPRLARIGDAFTGGVVVHNYSNTASQVRVGIGLSGTGIALDGPAEQSVAVEPGSAKEVMWKCRGVAVGKAVFSFRAAAGKDTDGLEWTIPVGVPEKLETVATTGVSETAVVEGLAVPAGSDTAAGRVQLTLASSAMVGLRDSAEFLLYYPYGCLEQKLSRCLPVITGEDLVNTYRLGSLGDLRKSVQEVMTHLNDYQDYSGGFRYWTDMGLPDPYITAYALEVASLAVKEKYTVDPAVLAAASRWLREYLVSQRREWAYPYSESEDYAARAYAIYALALNNERVPEYFSALYARRDQLPFLARAYLLKAGKLLGQDAQATNTLASELLNQSRINIRTLHFEEPVENRMPWIHASTVQTTAVCLQSLLEARGGFPGDEKAVAFLVGERKSSGHWRSTLENSSTLRTLQDFYRRYEKDTPDFRSTIVLEPGKTLATDSFRGRSLESKSRVFDLAEVFAGSTSARMTFRKEGKGRLYYSVAMSYSPPRNTTPASEGFEVEKTLLNLNGEPITGPVKAGTRVVVMLKIRTPMDRTFVAINDPLPAGFEIVNTSFATEGREDERKMRRIRRSPEERGYWWGSFFNNEKYDDRIYVYADFLSQGEHSYKYLVQATTPGKFIQPSTWVEMMYEPEVFGRTASSVINIEK